jgi:allantoin racemase
MKRIIEHPEADAFVIAGYNDMGLDAFRSITEKPVLGSGVASMHVATLLASRFSIVCPLARCIPCIYRTLRNSGFINRCEKVRPTDVPVMQFETTNKHEINTNNRTVGKEIERAFVEDNVGAVLLGCSALGHVRQVKFCLSCI